MDKAFIEKNQIVERYLTGKLPFKGRQDFERFCRENPSLLEELKLADHLNAGMRLLEASGLPADLREPTPPWWQRPWLPLGLGGACLALLIGLWAVSAAYSGRGERIAELESQLAEGTLAPPSTTRAIKVTPERAKTSRTSTTLRLRTPPELVELRIDMSFARLNRYRVTVERRGQARAGSIHNVLRDSNGEVRLLVNTSALHPGVYEVTIEGITRTGRTPLAWVNVQVVE